jgi:serine/threonine-protein kinase
MAPEQARHEPVDRRADVFSLGVVLYELLTDVKPFRGSTLEEITEAVLKHDPPLASTIEPAVPAALAEIVAKAIAKNPEHRYRSARAFARDLRHWLDENTSNATDSEVPIVSARQPRRTWFAAAVVGAAVIGGLIWAGMATRPSEPTPTPAPAASAVALAPVPASVPSPAPALATPPEIAPTAATPASDIAATASTTSAATSGASGAADTAAEANLVTAAPVVAKAPAAVAKTPRETPKERRVREAREREARQATPAPVAVAPAPARGLLRIAVSPWGDIEVDGRPAGTSPPLTELSLPEGKHQIVIRNADLPAHSAVVTVTADQPVTLKHKF